MIHKVIMIMICLFWLVDMYVVAKTGLMRARGDKYINKHCLVEYLHLLEFIKLYLI